MSKKTVLVISDGNGVENDFHKWPFFLKLLTTKTLNIVNKSIVGCSNELMFYQLINTIKGQNIDCAIIQWTAPLKVDVIADEFWISQANKDPVYDFNVVNVLNNSWWVSSASKNPYICDYNTKYIKNLHAELRSMSWFMAASEVLKSNKIEYKFSLCYKFNFISPFDNMLAKYPWVWHAPNQGINEFRYNSQYLKYDKGLPQPHPLIGLEWVNKVLKPQCDFIDYSGDAYYNIEKSLLKNVQN